MPNGMKSIMNHNFMCNEGFPLLVGYNKYIEQIPFKTTRLGYSDVVLSKYEDNINYIGVDDNLQRVLGLFLNLNNFVANILFKIFTFHIIRYSYTLGLS